jgi:peptide/nickel transport system permease protein
MAEASLPIQSEIKVNTHNRFLSTFTRVMKYMTLKIVMVFATIVVGVYLTIIIANMGGYVDRIQEGQIQEQISNQVINDPQFKLLAPDVRKERIAKMTRLAEIRAGLDQPFLIRSFRFLSDALSLNLGRAIYMNSDGGSKQVRRILLERLPSTMVLFATENLINFFLSVFFALTLSRKYGSLIDRVIIALSPTSSAPGWFYGLFLILFFAAGTRVLPFGGMVDAPPPAELFEYALSLIKHLILPVSALILATIFGNVYAWRTYFLIYSSEEYVEMAKAKGIPSRDLERRYILRPTLPAIITNFALSLITVWQGAIVLETVFNWPGIGRLLFQSIGLFDTPVIVGSTVIYAYLLGITVLLLEFAYTVVDPRVKLGDEGQKV